MTLELNNMYYYNPLKMFQLFFLLCLLLFTIDCTVLEEEQHFIFLKFLNVLNNS